MGQVEHYSPRTRSERVDRSRPRFRPPLQTPWVAGSRSPPDRPSHRTAATGRRGVPKMHAATCAPMRRALGAELSPDRRIWPSWHNRACLDAISPPAPWINSAANCWGGRVADGIRRTRVRTTAGAIARCTQRLEPINARSHPSQSIQISRCRVNFWRCGLSGSTSSPRATAAVAPRGSPT